MAEEQRRAYAIKIAAEESDSIRVKYRLLLRPTQRGIMHLLEIMEEGEARGGVQVPLLGDWERALKHADRVIDAISKEAFREVARVLVEMQRRGGITGAGAQEVE
jgi:membrane protein required for beta-lactamase induction